MSLVDIFLAAGIKKDHMLDRWEFFFPTPKKVVESESCHVSPAAIEKPPAAQIQNTTEAIATLEIKSKKKKSKKKKSVSSATDECSGPMKHVSWGNVEEITFTRSISSCSIPNKGSYPLGLGDVVERTTVTIDQLFMQQQVQLIERAKLIGITMHTSKVNGGALPPAALKSVGSPVGSPSGSPVISKGKKGIAPPAPAVAVPTPPAPASGKSKANAHKAAAAAAPAETSTKESNGFMSPLFETRQYDFKPVSNMLFRPTSEDERILLLMADKTNWNKLVDSSHSPVDHSAHHQSVADSLNKEVKTIKSSRDHDSAGCNCKHAKLDKMSVTKMRSELTSHGHLLPYCVSSAEIEAMNKGELTEKVREMLRYCSLCTENNCACVQSGVGCNAMVCGCLRGSTHHVNANQTQLCANPEGFSRFEPEAVKEYRQAKLAEVNVEFFSTPNTINQATGIIA